MSQKPFPVHKFTETNKIFAIRGLLISFCAYKQVTHFVSKTIRNQEIIKVREVIPHTGPIPIVIPLRLFLDDINFPADNVTARVTWKFRGGEKVQQILYDATLRFQS